MIPTLKKLGFKGGHIDPCLLIKRDSDGLYMVVFYVGVDLMVGQRKQFIQESRG